jgi:hypothetical protein
MRGDAHCSQRTNVAINGRAAHHPYRFFTPIVNTSCLVVVWLLSRVSIQRARDMKFQEIRILEVNAHMLDLINCSIFIKVRLFYAHPILRSALSGAISH